MQPPRRPHAPPRADGVRRRPHERDGHLQTARGTPDSFYPSLPPYCSALHPRHTRSHLQKKNTTHTTAHPFHHQNTQPHTLIHCTPTQDSPARTTLHNTRSTTAKCTRIAPLPPRARRTRTTPEGGRRCAHEHTIPRYAGGTWPRESDPVTPAQAARAVRQTQTNQQHISTAFTLTHTPRAGSESPKDSPRARGT